MRPSGSKLATGRPWDKNKTKLWPLIRAFSPCWSIWPGTAWGPDSQVLWDPTASQFCPGSRSGLCRPQDSPRGSPPKEGINSQILPCHYLLLVPIEILEVLVVMEWHVANGVALPLLVWRVHNGVGGVCEVNQVTPILQRLHHLVTQRR